MESKSNELQNLGLIIISYPELFLKNTHQLHSAKSQKLHFFGFFSPTKQAIKRGKKKKEQKTYGIRNGGSTRSNALETTHHIHRFQVPTTKTLIPFSFFSLCFSLSTSKEKREREKERNFSLSSALNRVNQKNPRNKHQGEKRNL